MDWEDTGRGRQAFWLALESSVARKIRRGMAALIGRDPFYGDRRAYQFAHGFQPSSRIALVNHFIRLNGYRSYLEIGVRDRGAMFQKIDTVRSISVDPDPAAMADHVMPSDAFFAENRERFDIVFIDGNHTGEQVERDIVNSLTCLAPNGVILLHDMNPQTIFHGRREYEVSGRYPAWNGTSWKGFAALRISRADLSMYVVDTEWSVGIVHPGRQDPISCRCERYTDLAARRQEILNLISVPRFLVLYSQPFLAAHAS